MRELNQYINRDGSPDWETIRRMQRPGDTFTITASMHFQRQNIDATINLYKLSAGHNSKSIDGWLGGVTVQGDDDVNAIVHLGELALKEKSQRARTASKSRAPDKKGKRPQKHSDDHIRDVYKSVADGREAMGNISALFGVDYKTLKKRSLALGLAWPPEGNNND